MFFPNVAFESEHVEFGCILNDTETIRYVSMINNSPLEVRYTWSFLKRPPVQRAPDYDEGVDMESECETDSLDEDSRSRESSEGGDEEREGAGERSEVDGSYGEERSTRTRPRGIHIQIADKDEIIGSSSDGDEGSSHGEQSVETQETSGEIMQEAAHSLGNDAVPEEIESFEGRILSRISEEQFQQSQVEVASDGSAYDDEVIESGLPPGVSEIEVVPEFAPVDISPVGVEEKPIVTKTKRKKEEKEKSQPWELTYDPFTPISIEQVSHH